MTRGEKKNTGAKTRTVVFGVQRRFDKNRHAAAWREKNAWKQEGEIENLYPENRREGNRPNQALHEREVSGMNAAKAEPLSTGEHHPRHIGWRWLKAKALSTVNHIFNNIWLHSLKIHQYWAVFYINTCIFRRMLRFWTRIKMMLSW